MQPIPLEEQEARLEQALRPIVDRFPELFAPGMPALSIFIVQFGKHTPIVLYLTGSSETHVPPAADALIRPELDRWPLWGIYELQFSKPPNPE